MEPLSQDRLVVLCYDILINSYRTLVWASIRCVLKKISRTWLVLSSLSIETRAATSVAHYIRPNIDHVLITALGCLRRLRKYNPFPYFYSVSDIPTSYAFGNPIQDSSLKPSI